MWLAGSWKTILISAAQSTDPSSRTTPTPAAKAKAQALEFKPTMRGGMRTGYGAHLGFPDFKTSDGIAVTVLYNASSDSAASSSVFEHEIARAAIVISRTPKKDSAGKVVGERAEVLFLYSDREFHAVLWTWGPSFHEIKSSSLSHVVEMEKSYRHY
jgi:hypothetical protein